MTGEQQGQVSQSWDKMSLSQLQIYAQEVRQLFEEEQKLRRQLEEEKTRLEQKVQELSALNRMFQGYLQTKFQMEDAYQGLIDEMRKAVGRAQELLDSSLTQRPQGPGGTNSKS